MAYSLVRSLCNREAAGSSLGIDVDFFISYLALVYLGDVNSTVRDKFGGSGGRWCFLTQLEPPIKLDQGWGAGWFSEYRDTRTCLGPG